MKLNQLTINRLPGIDRRFSIEARGAGIHVVFGPNGIGKSSLCRATLALYWPDHGGDRETSINAEFERSGTVWRAEREGSDLRWRRGDGQQIAPSLHPPPDLPPSHGHRSFFLRLRDLIDPEQDSNDVAKEIQRQMSGGFDPDEVISNLFNQAGSLHGRHESRQLEGVRREIDALVRKQKDLKHDEDQIDGLLRELEEAQAQVGKIAAVERAMELAGRRREQEDVQRQIDVLPPSLAKLTGKETEQVEEHAQRIDALAGRIRSSEQRIENARNAAQRTGLDAPIDAAEITAWGKDANELQNIQVDLRSARKELETSRGKLRAALAAIGGGDIDQVGPNTEAHGRLFEFLREAESHRTKTSEIRSRLDLLEPGTEEEIDTMQRQCDQLRDAANLLRAWLRAPDDHDQSTMTMDKGSRSKMILAVLATMLGGVFAILFDSIFVKAISFLFSLLGAAFAIGLLLMLGGRRAPSGRDAARDAFMKLDMDAPLSWDIDEVGRRLATLESDLGSLTAKLQKVQIDASTRQSLVNDLQGLAEVEERIAQRRQSLMAELNLQELRPDAELVELAHALDDVRSAKIEAESASSQVEHLEEQFAALLEPLANSIERHGETKPGSATSAIAAVDELAKRSERLDRALSEGQEAEREFEQLTADLDREREAKRKIYEGVSLEDDDAVGLADLTRQLPQYSELKVSLQSLASKIASDREALAEMGAVDLADEDVDVLGEMLDEFNEKTLRLDELRKEIADIEAEVGLARESSELEGHLKSLETARDALRERLNEALFDEAGKFLVRSVEREYEKDRLPAVLQRARDHFGTFTRHRYELHVAKPGGVSQLMATDLENGKERKLGELSDGTRVQLLLAARLAHAEEFEHGEPMPLFLDEALDQSDPERFEAMVRSLGRLAREQDRQIFYLTSDSLDVDRMQHALAKDDLAIASEIDLGAIRRNAASARSTSDLAFRPGSPIPAPDGLSSEDYAKVLGVPAFNPMRGHDGQHFYYLLPDALPLLHELLCHGIEFTGQWRPLADAGFADRLEARSIPPGQITHRVQLLETFCALWHRGRGRPIDRDVLADSGAVTSTYFDALVEIVQEADGDAARVLGVIDDKKDERIKGFRAKNREGLMEYLRDHGHIADEEPLRREDLRTNALASPAAAEIPGPIVVDLLDHWWSWASSDG